MLLHFNLICRVKIVEIWPKNTFSIKTTLLGNSNNISAVHVLMYLQRKLSYWRVKTKLCRDLQSRKVKDASDLAGPVHIARDVICFARTKTYEGCRIAFGKIFVGSRCALLCRMWDSKSKFFFSFVQLWKFLCFCIYLQKVIFKFLYVNVFLY